MALVLRYGMKAVRQAQMRIAVYGGSFNPVGNHHVALVQALLAAGRYDRVVVVPNGDGYGKPGLAPEGHRLAMCRLAFAETPAVTVCALETGLPPGREAARDVDTLEALGRQFPGAVFDSVRGADALEKLLGFGTYERLRDTVRAFVIVPRRVGSRTVTLDSAVQGLRSGKRRRYERDAGKFVVLDLDVASDGSSSAVRDRIAQSEPIGDLVPEVVARHIAAHGLYRRAPRPTGAMPRRQERAPRPVHDPRQVVICHRPRNNSYVLDAAANGLYWCARFDATVGTGQTRKRFAPQCGKAAPGQETRWETLCSEGSMPDPEHRVRLSVSSRSRDGYAGLSPFAIRPDGFPVPGLLGSDDQPVRAYSVENAWQGLKCYPESHPEPFLDLVTYGQASVKLKRWLRHIDRGDLEGQRYQYRVGGRLTDDKAEAVFLTYLPMYIWCIETFEASLLDRLVQMARQRIVWLWDTDSNEDISRNEAFSHAAFLVHYLNGDWFGFYRQYWPAAGDCVSDWLAQLPEPYRSQLPALLRRRPA